MSALLVLFLVGVYLSIGGLAAVHTGSWVWEREVRQAERYTYITVHPDSFGLVFAVIGTLIAWPLVWPVWRIVSIVMEGDPAREHERVPS